MRSQLCKSKKGRWVMFRKVLALVAVVLAFGVCDLQAAQINSTWVGGVTGSWGQASNWSPAIVPDNGGGNTFAVTIDSTSLGAHEGIDVYIIENRTINQLDCYGEVDLESGTPFRIILTLYGLTNYDEFSITGQSQQIEIHGNLTNSEQANLWFDLVEMHGDVYNNTESILEVEGENDIHNGDLQNDGTVVLGPASDLLVEDGEIRNIGTITLHDGECGTDVFDNNSTGVIQGFGIVWANQLLRNKGQIIASGGSLAVASEGPLENAGLLRNNPTSSLHIKPAVDVNNFGIIEVNAGGVAFDCNLVNEPNNLVSGPNGVIKLLGGTLAATTITQKAGAIFEGFGGITGDVVIDPDAKIELTGPTNIVGDVNIPAGATLEISDGQTLITGQTVNNGTIELVGGTVIFQGGYSGGGTIPVTAGTDRNHFDVNSDGIEDFKDFASFANSWLWQASWY